MCRQNVLSEDLIVDVMNRGGCSRQAARKRISNYMKGKITKKRLFKRYTEQPPQTESTDTQNNQTECQSQVETTTSKGSGSAQSNQCLQTVKNQVTDEKSFFIGRLWFLIKELPKIDQKRLEDLYTELQTDDPEYLQKCVKALQELTKLFKASSKYQRTDYAENQSQIFAQQSASKSNASGIDNFLMNYEDLDTQCNVDGEKIVAFLLRDPNRLRNFISLYRKNKAAYKELKSRIMKIIGCDGPTADLRIGKYMIGYYDFNELCAPINRARKSSRYKV